MTERLEEIKEEYRDAIRVIGIARKDIDYLIQQAERVEELEKDIANYKKACTSWETVESYSRKEAQRYKQALELVEDELEYAKTTGNDEVRDMYIKNSIRFINEALEREG